MSSINTQFGQRTFSPTVSTRDPGLAFGSGDDFLSPRTISNIGSGFARSISPISSRSPYITDSDPFSHNATPNEILLRTTSVIRTIQPPTGLEPTNIVPLPALPYPYYQPVPNTGTNPNAMMVLSASTQFQNGMVTVGPSAIPGFPVVNYGTNPEAIDFMGHTDAFISAIVPYHPLASRPGAWYPAGGGYNLVYPAPPIQPPYYSGPLTPTNYPHFAPYHGYGVVPSQIPYPARPVSTQSSTESLVNLIRNNIPLLPGFIPSQIQGGVAPFINRFNTLPESQRVAIRQELVNPTTVDQSILNQSGITNTGGLYNQGQVYNPFAQSTFLSDTNPFARYNSGVVVTNGNDNGKIKGTPVNDILLGTQGRSNIVDGMGGEDNILTSSQADLVNVHQGDRASTAQGDDLLFFSFVESPANVTRQTVVEGGDGNDTMVLTVSGNPSQEASLPRFTTLSNGLTSVTLNGIQLLTQNIERYIIVDAQGNVGSVYHSSTSQTQQA